MKKKIVNVSYKSGCQCGEPHYSKIHVILPEDCNRWEEGEIIYGHQNLQELKDMAGTIYVGHYHGDVEGHHDYVWW